MLRLGTLTTAVDCDLLPETRPTERILSVHLHAVPLPWHSHSYRVVISCRT